MLPHIVGSARKEDVSIGAPMPVHLLRDEEFQRLSAQDPSTLSALLKKGSRSRAWVFSSGVLHAAIDSEAGNPASCSVQELDGLEAYGSWRRQFARTPWLQKQPMSLIEYDGLIMALFRPRGQRTISSP